tara:strand:+ start:218 stop:799 length:582 start_codon:yes stop_codon:yes gene_type:complete
MDEQNKVQDAPQEEQPQKAQEMATDSQDQPTQGDVGELIAESKKYRQRSQKAEAELVKLQKQVDHSRQKQMEEQNQWQQLAEERGAKIAELEPIVVSAKEQEDAMRAELLKDFDEEDRVTFSDLSLPKLKVVRDKLFNNSSKVAVDNSSPSSNGGYSSALEFVLNDPKGYEKSKKTNTFGKFGNIFSPNRGDS